MVAIGERYHHYKWTWGSNYTYEVIWVARDSDTEEVLVLYKPLYTEEQASGDHKETIQDFMSEVWADCCARTLKVREEIVEHNGKQMRRFIKFEN